MEQRVRSIGGTGLCDRSAGVADWLWEGSRLDNGVVVHMKPGDVCVQRGTIHGWTNPHDEPARVYFVLTAAEAVQLESGEVVGGDEGFKEEEVGSGGK